MSVNVLERQGKKNPADHNQQGLKEELMSVLN
jgi:hypothetical protein